MSPARAIPAKETRASRAPAPKLRTEMIARGRMSQWDRRSVAAFWIRFGILFAVAHAPLPWLADSYVTAYETVANVGLFALDGVSRLSFRFEPPDSIRAQGSWTGVLRVEDPRAGERARMKFDVRSFSYRPLATLVALALAARLTERRNSAIVLGGGLALVATITSLIAVLAAFRFGIGRALGFGPSRVIETLYEILTTPAVTYLIPALCFLLALRWATGPFDWARVFPAVPAYRPDTEPASPGEHEASGAKSGDPEPRGANPPPLTSRGST